jgi:choline kinase
MIRDKGDFIEMDVIVEKYKKRKRIVKDSDGNKVLQESGKTLKEYVNKYNGFFTLPTNFIKECITLYGPVSTQQNRVMKTRSTVYDKYSNKFYVVNHPFQEIEKTLNSRPSIGFKLTNQ